ncbi:hypothetical protein ASD21_21640 [Caulobacter sp. Root1455]|uniref:peptidoglycan DD-metalloendopeptidase family protein n=1 Tax=Caulobacter sp. Root1455 TaxID=1736465 RepID=UPI0006F66C80|nr:peptidoglycan DD-metalloendopeptidase family protein [Caulobacter sp. Root1455]KQZ02724.1 hypothetical protein ASD21_21640 [Caulobacter sp. Root1455]
MAVAAWAAVATSAVAASEWRPDITFNYGEPQLAASQGSTPGAFYLDSAFQDAGGRVERLGYDPKTLAGVYLGWPATTLVNDHSYLASPQRYFIQVSTEGQALEGHAVLTFFRLAGDKVVIDGAFGLYSVAGQDDFTPSFLLYRGEPFADECYAERTRDRDDESDDDSPTPARVFSEANGLSEPRWTRGCYRAPSAAAQAALRAHLTGYFGPLPHALAGRLLTDPGDATFLSVDADDYAIKLAGMRKRMPEAPKVVDPGYVRGEFQTHWRAAANLVCMNLYPLDCRGVAPGAALWPQAHLGAFLREHRRAVDLGGPSLVRFEADDTPRALRIIGPAANQTGAPGDDLVCPASWRPFSWGPAGSQMRYSAFRGRLTDGYPEGQGTLFLLPADCEVLRQAPEGEARLETSFVRGVPNGQFTLYNAIGKLVLAGAMKDGLLDGEVHRYGDFGTEISTVQYRSGRLADGDFTFYDLDYLASVLAPPPARQFFRGKVSGEELSGAWSDLVITLGAEGQRVGLYKGRQTVELSDGETISGPVFPDYDRLRYRFTGQGEYDWPSGARLVGDFDPKGEEGIRGRARYYDPRRGRWYNTTVDANGRFTWTVVKRVRRPWYENVAPELKRWVDTVVDQVDRGGHGFEHFMCRLTGTEEGRNCSVSAGVQVGTDGPVLTDGLGTPSALPLREDPDWAARLDWAHATELQDVEHGDDSLSPFFADVRELRVGRTPADLTGTVWSPLIYMGTPTVSGEERSDSHGQGHFLSPRRNDDGSRRVHLGRDYLAAPGDPILAPMDGIVTVARYDPANIYRCFIQITNPQGRAVEISYVAPLGRAGAGPASIKAGTYVTRGTMVGHAVDISPVYGPHVGNHVHVQYFVPKPGAAAGVGWWVSYDGETWVSKQPRP